MAVSFSKKLQNLKSIDRYRSLSPAAGIDLSSNDYLGLKDHPVLQEAAVKAVRDGVGLGAGGSRLLRGNAPEHEALEDFAAAHYGFDRSLYFANGYSANYALLTSLAGRHDIVLYDEYVHASMRDGLFTPTVKSQKFAHNDLVDLERLLQKYGNNSDRIYVAVESLYSMDGDMAPLRGLYELALRYGAILIVDEAHGTGVFGAHGKGLSDELPREHLITVHTCGKALGVAGGLVCASTEVIEFMINAARPFIYSTAPPPLQAYLTQKAIELASGSIGDHARTELRKRMKIAEETLGGYGTQIVPIILGEDARAVAAAKAMQKAGFDIRAVRPPTVPDGTARLRLSLNSKLDEACLLEFLARVRPITCS